MKKGKTVVAKKANKKTKSAGGLSKLKGGLKAYMEKKMSAKNGKK